MFYLTPQERTVLIGFIIICCVGTGIHTALQRNARPLRWVKTSSQKIRYVLPNINTDDARRLEKIDGVGPKLAARIVAYRTEHGLFATLDDLRKVKGITARNFQKIKMYYEASNDQNE